MRRVARETAASLILQAERLEAEDPGSELAKCFRRLAARAGTTATTESPRYEREPGEEG